MRTDFYVYGHYDVSGRLRYIGKGRKNRAWTFLQRSKLWEKTFSGQNPEVRILEKNLTEDAAYEREKAWIDDALALGHPLVNLARGGNDKESWDERAREMLGEMRRGEKHPLYGRKVPKEQIERTLKTKRDRDSFGRYWLGKKRDPELIKKMVAAAHTPEAVEKRRQKMIGRKLSSSHKKKIGQALSGTVRSEETKKKISDARKGQPNGRLGTKHSEETKKKISKAHMGRKISQESIEKRRKKLIGRPSPKRKKVLCVTNGIIYSCAKEAAEKLGASDKHIQACCAGRRKSHKGMNFSYA